MLINRNTIAMTIGALALLPCASHASVTLYTSSAAFTTALGSETVTAEDYGTLTPGTLIPNGSTVDGLTYNFTTTPTLSGGVITNQFNSFSGTSLGGDQLNLAAEFFFDGDTFNVTFPNAVNAFGAYFNVNADSGSFFVNTSAGDATTGSASYDISTFVFAGLISSTPFTSATIGSTSGGNGTASYNIPKLLYAKNATVVPEPSPVAVFAIAGLCVGVLILRGRRAGECG